MYKNAGKAPFNQRRHRARAQRRREHAQAAAQDQANLQEVRRLNQAVARVEKATRAAVAAGQYSIVKPAVGESAIQRVRHLPAAELRLEADRMLDRAESLFELGQRRDEAERLVIDAEQLLARAEWLDEVPFDPPFCREPS